MKNVDKLLNAAEFLIWLEIEKQVCRILKDKNNKAHSFISAMGGTCFYDQNGYDIPDRAWMKPVDNIYSKYDDIFRLSGLGVRWDLNPETGEVKNQMIGNAIYSYLAYAE